MQGGVKQPFLDVCQFVQKYWNKLVSYLRCYRIHSQQNFWDVFVSDTSQGSSVSVTSSLDLEFACDRTSPTTLYSTRWGATHRHRAWGKYSVNIIHLWGDLVKYHWFRSNYYLWAMYESMWKALSTRRICTPELMIGWSWQGCYVKDHGHVTRTWHLIGCHCSTSHVHRTLKKGTRTCFLQLLHTFNYYINVYWDFGTPIQLSTVQSVTTA